MTALIITDHMVGNNKYGESQSSSILHLCVDQLLPHACRASFDQILQLGPLFFFFYNTAFEQRHNLRSTSSSTAERQFTPQKGSGKSEGKELPASSASFSAASDGEGGHISPKVAQCVLLFDFDDALFLSCRQSRDNLQVVPAWE